MHSATLQSVVRKLEASKTGPKDKPEKDILIYDCGLLQVPEPFSVERDDAKD